MRREKLSSAEQDLLDAIDRLSIGRPRDRANKALQAVGKLQVTPTTVSREAGRSRQSVYRSERVRYALNVSRRLAEPGGYSLKEQIAEARDDRRTVLEENQLLISNLARAHTVAYTLMQELKELRQRFDRRQQQLSAAEAEIVELKSSVEELQAALAAERLRRPTN